MLEKTNEGGLDMPLIYADPGKTYRIVRISGQDKVKTHLRNMGLVENETISVITSINGNLIVEVKGVRIALDRSLAGRIFV